MIIAQRVAGAWLVGLAIYATAAVAAASDSVRIATWNMNNLHSVPDAPLRNGAPSRSHEDYRILQHYRDKVAADVYALQEVNGPAAAYKVFPKEQFDVYMSGRYVIDLAQAGDSDHIYTGFAVRRGRFSAITKLDYPALSVVHSDGHPLRWGTELLLEREGNRLRIMSIHLKSGCPQGNLRKSRAANCVTLARQLPALEQWLDARATEQIPFMIAGDFNRAFDKFGNDDYFWTDLDDHEPRSLTLHRLPQGQVQTCWQGTSLQHQFPIDFFVFDQRAWKLAKPGTFATVDYSAPDRDSHRKTPSDHCPLVVELQF